MMKKFLPSILFAIIFVFVGFLLRPFWDEFWKVEIRQDFTQKLNSGRMVKVKQVIDGDTIELENGERVRLIGIDAPESGDNSKLQRILEKNRISKTLILQWGNQSKIFLKNLVLGKKLKLVYDLDLCDRYGRTLAYLYFPGQSKSVNQTILEFGFAKIQQGFPFSLSSEFESSLEHARKQKLGLWQNPGFHSLTY